MEEVTSNSWARVFSPIPEQVFFFFFFFPAKQKSGERPAITLFHGADRAALQGECSQDAGWTVPARESAERNSSWALEMGRPGWRWSSPVCRENRKPDSGKAPTGPRALQCHSHGLLRAASGRNCDEVLSFRTILDLGSPLLLLKLTVLVQWTTGSWVNSHLSMLKIQKSSAFEFNVPPL